MNLYRGSLFAVIAVLAVHSAAVSQIETTNSADAKLLAQLPDGVRLSRIEANHGLADSPELSIAKRVARLECLLLGRAIVGPINRRLDELERIDRLGGRHQEDKSQGLSSAAPRGKTQGLTSSSSFNSSGLSSPIQAATVGPRRFGGSGMSGASGLSSTSLGATVLSPAIPQSVAVSSPSTKREMSPASERSPGASGFAQGLSPPRQAPAVSSPRRASAVSSSLPNVRPGAQDAIATVSPTGNAGSTGSTVQNFKWTRDESKQYFPDGANITVDKNSAAAAYDCMKGSAIINASNCDLTFRGSYKQVTVRGSNNKIVLHNASAVAINGDANNIFWSAESAPKIVNTGNKNSITRRQ